MVKVKTSRPGAHTAVLCAAAITTLVGWAPAILALASALAAFAFGCEVNAAYARACPVLGTDISEALYMGFMSAFLIIFTAPAILASIVLWAVFIALRVQASRVAADGAHSPAPHADRSL